jgi:glucose-1-phosphate thymidylyltransferase
LYYFGDSVLLRKVLSEHINSGKLTSGEIQFTDALQDMIEAGTSFVPHTVGGWHDCGTVHTLISANRQFIERLAQPAPTNGSSYIAPVFVADDAIVKHSVIGPNVTIESGARIENCILKDCIVNTGAIIKNVISEDSLFGRSAVVEGIFQTLNVGQGEHLSIGNGKSNK